MDAALNCADWCVGFRKDHCCFLFAATVLIVPKMARIKAAVNDAARISLCKSRSNIVIQPALLPVEVHMPVSAVIILAFIQPFARKYLPTRKINHTSTIKNVLTNSRSFTELVICDTMTTAKPSLKTRQTA